jgi:uncharacterized membrane protein
MPLRQFLILIGLFGCCLAIVGVAWVSGGELFLWLPIRRGRLSLPPSYPGLILGCLVFSLGLTAWLRQFGAILLYMLTAGMLLGSVIGFFVYHWTPSWPQYLLTIAMITTCVYASKQGYYLDD